MYNIHNLSLKIGKKYLLQDINIHFKANMVNAIIGPNGAGKSTLIKAIAGLSSKYTGEIFFDGVNIKTYNSKEYAKKRAFLNQQPNTAFSFAVYDIVMMGRFPFFRTAPSAIDKAIVKKSMEITGIAHLAERNSETLSGGEIQRVHFARVIVQCLNLENDLRKKVLLLDEPANNLDPKYQFELMETVQKLATGCGLTVIMVMHDLNLTAQFSKQIVLMNKGRIVDYDIANNVLQTQKLEEVYEIPFAKIESESGFYIRTGLGKF